MVVQHHATERWKFLFWGLALSLCGLAAINVVAVLEAIGHDRPARVVVIVQALACLAGLMGLFELRKAFVAMLEAQVRINRQQARAYRQDVVTGALNRAGFIAECEAQLRTRKDGFGYFLHIDLDYLKRINDSLGHAKGDAALRHAAEIARAMAPACAFGRLGGDEFALLVMKRPHKEAIAFANEYLARLAMTVWHQSQPMNLSASIGVALLDPEIAGFDELVHRADLALYESKRNGRAQATLFRPEMVTDLRYARLIERELRAAILLGELELAYQPLYRGDGTLVGFEAQVQWRHSLRGLIAPSEFVPVAERSVLIDLLGEWVLRRACTDMRDYADLDFSVNFSANQFKRDSVVSMVAAVLAETGTAPGRLVIEITENAAMGASEDVRERLAAIRRLGVRIALDDFGAGLSGFAYLQSFPVDAIKVDRAFISKLGTNSASNVLVAALVSVAHASGISVVAEGVETEDQHRLALLAGADVFQGDLLAQPTTLGAIRELCYRPDSTLAALTPRAMASGG
ncbi:bifunctional diguanylate cyclase/phosphodiesterase [Aurantimonas sp. 22II-16-19i]|uniref:putative bifunctional diguanylate cyclase/phosphodiesterase n=1 Tax=Aurantimonas sp. 22II-16-19i TaxID=1317114 RepID=UPI0009F7BDD5|nr:bifunctional diguanylate cyclase/phosphodiesterase [Aurantimonas sp. 22II-16-19i]ORE97615.1 diguanylate cyclase (GGDEF) domain-containing protein [Aurantimonas sp. 22II-16-19i]